jgi:hypothetical protein
LLFLRRFLVILTAVAYKTASSAVPSLQPTEVAHDDSSEGAEADAFAERLLDCVDDEDEGLSDALQGDDDDDDDSEPELSPEEEYETGVRQGSAGRGSGLVSSVVGAVRSVLGL